MNIEKSTRIKPIYFWGLVGLIPNLGAFIGFTLLILGIYKTRDKFLVIIGTFCIVWTLVLDSYYFFQIINNPNIFGSGKENITRYEINELVKEIELFKVRLGRYPSNLLELDSLLKSNGNYILIMDPYQIGQNNNNNTGLYYYKLLGDKYEVFSIGKDRIANTSDDIYPNLSKKDKGKIGYITKK